MYYSFIFYFIIIIVSCSIYVVGSGVALWCCSTLAVSFVASYCGMLHISKAVVW